MPFKSEKQRKWMHANEPEMAKKWEKEEQKEAVQVNIDKVLKNPKIKQLMKRLGIKQAQSYKAAMKILNYLANNPHALSTIKHAFESVKEERDYKAEYKKYGSSTKAKKYRAELNQYNRKKGTYGNGDGKDASHKGGKIVGFENQSVNRGRAEKSRLKKESINEAKEIKFHQIQPKDYIWYRGGIQYFVTKTGPNVLHMGLVNKGKPGSGGSLFASNTKLTRKNFDSQIRVKFIKKITRGQNTLWQESVNEATNYYKSKRKSDDLFYKKVGNKWYKSLANKKGKVGWYVVKFPRDLDKKDMNKINKTKLPNVLRESVNEAIKPQGYSQLNRAARTLPSDIKDFLKALKKQDDDAVEREILYLKAEFDTFAHMLKDKKYTESVNEAKSANNKNIKKKLDSGEWKVIGHSKKKGKSTLHIRDKSGKRFDLKVNESVKVRRGETAKIGKWEVYNPKTNESIKEVGSPGAATRLMNRLMSSGQYDNVASRHVETYKKESIKEKISKDEWAQYPKYARKLKPYMRRLLKIPVKVRVIKQANHNPWIDVRVARFGKDVIPNDFRKRALKAIGGGRPRDMDNITYGNITAGSVSLKYDQWVKLLGNKVK